ncbi:MULTISPECIES: alkene reductase [unclassified Chelatococcus]|uniref:alkene reductase n=1 Tax=unclassified Chelatococcus TaxID=2638111 RepID=UPI001BCCD6C1|nr:MULTISPECIES: alkene reductase [unclassified Chelatococcus]CAH1671181.1 N-ethylmaleimide reductase [Hyphomicrobiales bacterium]MBS7738430.1 alkene reductase [Chelatococcus sp. HY11]MBX3542834.1 alkene reductase [Chelatococcus sp.]MCO5077040.1 alkene reductase [Chelatococcus sp.]CAH1676602.1 N-ethylmaleimide reductase [Hyphomicrobiales bacterium]
MSVDASAANSAAKSADASILFSPFRLGAIDVANRLVMAPLTRNRAISGDIPSDLAIDYYRQRAGAGLIISEGTQISPQGQGYMATPGIYSEAQIAGWRKITDAVHDLGGKIIAQVWHVGRVSSTELQPGGGAPVAPSAIPAHTKTYLSGGFAEVSAPRALALEEIQGIVDDYAAATRNAREAGFDGIELHGANGYLIDQFLKDGTNHRTDRYGGSIENRVRFAVEVATAAVKAWDKGRVGIRLSPVSPANDISDSNPQPLFNHLVAELDKLELAFIHVIEGATGGPRDIAAFDFQALRKAFRGAYIANNGYTRDLAIAALTSGNADLIAFGRAFISNPDLPERLRRDASLAEVKRETLYGGGAEGYTDYPSLADAAA